MKLGVASAAERPGHPTADDVMRAVRGMIIAEGETVRTYARGGR
jgi:hypothetical protein